MADARHRFVPTEQSSTQARAATRRAASSSPFLRTGTAWALVLGAAFLIARPFFAPGAADAGTRFTRHQVQFQLIKDMLLAEPAVTSVGADNVREYWLFDGRWSSPRRPGKFLSRADMLEAVALTPARYDAYLDLLKTVGAYRAAQSGAGDGRRVTIHLLPSSKNDGETARLVYSPGAVAPKRAQPLGGDWYLETERR